MMKKDIIDIVSRKTGLNRNHTRAVVECVLDVFMENLANEGRIEIRNFGVFKVKRTPRRMGRNPVTREEAVVPARNIVQFKAGRTMKNLVNVDLKPRGGSVEPSFPSVGSGPQA